MKQTKGSKRMGGISLAGGKGNTQHHTAKTGPQAPGVTSVSKGSSSPKFGADAGRSGSMSKQSVTAVTPGQTGKGGYSGMPSGGKKKKGYGGDASGKPY